VPGKENKFIQNFKERNYFKDLDINKKIILSKEIRLYGVGGIYVPLNRVQH
jgi:hypothetical protein